MFAATVIMMRSHLHTYLMQQSTLYSHNMHKQMQLTNSLLKLSLGHLQSLDHSIILTIWINGI